MSLVKLYNDDCLEKLKRAPDNSVDSLVTDPPAGIGFMSKAWDGDKGGREQWIAWMQEVMTEALRVMKPGAHGLVWALPRTSHWTGTALENAGFEVRDSIVHLFGSGFPKSRNIGEGRGTALKPAHETWILIRKPLGESTVAKNVLKHGTGALNIDASRIDNGDIKPGAIISSVGQGFYNKKKVSDWLQEGRTHAPCGKDLSLLWIRLSDSRNELAEIHANEKRQSLGRFPANLMLSHLPECEDACAEGCPVAELGEPSRFFYCAKASKRDKGVYNTHPTVKNTALMKYLITLITPPGGTVLDPFMGSGSTGVAAVADGFGFIGIEQDAEYFEIAKKRIG